MPVTQANRQVSVTTALGEDVLLFRSMSGSEQLGRLSEFRVQLLSSSNELKIGDVLGKPLGVHMELADGSKRHFHGYVTRFCSTGWQGSFCVYEATVHPWLWLMTRSSDCRIFQNKSVSDIVKAVCGDAAYAGGEISFQLNGTYTALDYCVQYRESDFQFVCRLMEQAGMYFFIKHDADKHTVVVTDSFDAHTAVAGYETVKFAGVNGREVPNEEYVYSWLAGGEIQAGAYALQDYDFEKSAASISGGLLVKSSIPAAFEQALFERFDYPGLYNVSGTGEALARVRMERLHGQCERIEAETNVRGLHAGALFTLSEHPRADQNREFLVTAASYDIVSDEYAASGTSEPMRFEARITAVGKEHSYRPLPLFVKPFVQGPQTAMVVGKAGEEIWTDKYGRVKVQFHWDRLGKADENSSCWVRVSQTWAGKGWGAMFIPRIGMEVVVSFLEGDPDRPLITGCVYNSDAMPPYALPGEQTKSTIMSNSSKGGAGYNEMRFEDKKGSEEIYVQAEKDHNRVVKNNDTLKVGFEKKDKGNQTIGIFNDKTVDIGNDHIEKIGNNQTITIEGDQKVTSKKTIVIEATTSIELKCGNSSIKLEPAKITIKTVEIAAKADANVAIEAGALMKIKSGAVMTIEGALVKIN